MTYLPQIIIAIYLIFSVWVTPPSSKAMEKLEKDRHAMKAYRFFIFSHRCFLALILWWGGFWGN